MLGNKAAFLKSHKKDPYLIESVYLSFQPSWRLFDLSCSGDWLNYIGCSNVHSFKANNNKLFKSNQQLMNILESIFGV